MRLALALLPLLWCFTTAMAQEGSAANNLTLKVVAKGFKDPVAITSIAADPTKLYVIERRGSVAVVENGKRARRDLLDIRDILSPNENTALSSIAFPSDYAHSQAVYVNYTDKQGDTIIGRFPTKTSETVNEEALMVVLKVVQPAPHLHTSTITFGPDGYLYISLSDVPRNYGVSSLAQNYRSLFGKILRIDLADPARYTIPSDNPFLKTPDAVAEVWALGFQQPRYLSFDKATNRLFVIDSGPRIQEVNLVERGRNYGWNVMEGNQCLSTKCNAAAYTPPLYSYIATGQARAVGGFVYNGSLFPNLKGSYIFADSETTALLRLSQRGNTWTRTVLASTTSPVVAVGPGADGEVYIATSDGSLSTLIPQ